MYLGRAATSGSDVWWLCVQVQNATPDLSQNPFEFLKQSSKEDAQAAKDEVCTQPIQAHSSLHRLEIAATCTMAT